jgi:pimeloyl-ACP methyl ester carboxylesterase
MLSPRRQGRQTHECKFKNATKFSNPSKSSDSQRPAAVDEYAFLNAPGQVQIQSDLFYDYRTNVEAYPKWQAWMQRMQPKLLVLWGRHDLSFDLGQLERYHKDVPSAEVYVLDAGHFALDTRADKMASLVSEFMKR